MLLTLSSIVTAQQTFFWPTSTPEEQGLSSTGINEAINLIVPGNYGQIRSLIVIKNGHMVSEVYFNGGDGITPVYSVTKSIGSALLGIAKYQGYSLDLDRSIMDYMPEYSEINDFEFSRLVSSKA